MARAARTGTVILALLVAVALAPAVATATIVGSTAVSIQSPVTVGQTGVPATITLTNLNEDPDGLVSNRVCNQGDISFGCGGTGITLYPACAFSGTDCPPSGAELNVFTVSPTAQGSGACPGLTLVTSAADPMTGAVVFTPEEGNISLPGTGASCTISFTVNVVNVPTTDTTDDAPGTQTFTIASADQVDGTEFKLGLARGTRQVFPGQSSTTVNTAPTAIATQASPNVELGGAISDTATVTGRVNPLPDNIVEFHLFGPDDATCMVALFSTEAPLSAEGTATSPPFVPTLAGTYRWIARYRGDMNNAAAQGSCNDANESTTVTAPVVTPPAAPGPRAQPALAITSSASSSMVGGRVSASATLTPAIPGAAVEFRLYGPDVAECAGTPIFTATALADAAGVATSPSFAPVTGGIYLWTASFAGDAANAPAATGCGAPGSIVALTPLAATILSAGFSSPPRVGVPTILTIGAFDPTRPIAGVQIRFGEPRGLTGISACELQSTGVSASPVLLGVPFTFRTPGRHVITITVLSGGCNTKLRRTTTTIEVVVAAASSRFTLRAAASRCKDAQLTPTVSAANRKRVAAAVLCLVNAERSKRKLKKLKRSQRLELAALRHSKDMIKRKYFEHTGPGGPTFKKRLTTARYRGRTAAENIGYGARFNAMRIVQAWLNSPPHKANMLAPQLRYAGTGVQIKIPLTPQSPGSSYTMDLGLTLK